MIRATTVARVTSSDPSLVTGVAARLLVVLAVLNVNNIVYMISGERQAISLAMLALSLVMVARTGLAALRGAFLVFVATIGAYLLLGALYAWDNNIDVTPLIWLRYAGTVLTVWAIVGYLLSIRQTPAFEKFLGFVFLVLLAAIATIWATPLLLPYWAYLPLDFESRLSGVFANPNEAGFVSAFALCFSLFFPLTLRAARPFLIAIALSGVVLSFSKTAAIVSLLIIALSLVWSFRGSAVVAATALSFAALVILPNITEIIGWAADQTLFPLDWSQRERLTEFNSLLSGVFDDQVTTGRTELWNLGIERIITQFPFGSGLETFLGLEGGLINPQTGGWQGVHNVFLLILGESGVVPFGLILFFFGYVTLRLKKNRLWGFGLAILLVLLADYNSNHGAITARYSNVFLGVVIALITPIRVRKRLLNSTMKA